MNKARSVAWLSGSLAFCLYPFTSYAENRPYYVQMKLLEAEYSSTSLDTKVALNDSSDVKLDRKGSSKSSTLVGNDLLFGYIGDKNLVQITHKISESTSQGADDLGSVFWGFRLLDFYVGPYVKFKYSMAKESNDTTGADSTGFSSTEENVASRDLLLGPRFMSYQERPWGFYDCSVQIAYGVSSVEGAATKQDLEGISFALGGNYGFKVSPELLFTGGLDFSYISVSNYKVDGKTYSIKGDGGITKIRAKIAGLRYRF